MCRIGINKNMNYKTKMKLNVIQHNFTLYLMKIFANISRFFFFIKTNAINERHELSPRCLLYLYTCVYSIFVCLKNIETVPIPTSRICHDNIQCIYYNTRIRIIWWYIQIYFILYGCSHNRREKRHRENTKKRYTLENKFNTDAEIFTQTRIYLSILYI